MRIKGWGVGKNAYFLYSSTSLLLYINVDEALYDIVWYGPLMVAMFTFFSFYICVDNGLEVKILIVKCGHNDHTMWVIIPSLLI